MRNHSYQLWQMKNGTAFISGNKTYLKVANVKGLSLKSFLNLFKVSK